MDICHLKNCLVFKNSVRTRLVAVCQQLLIFAGTERLSWEDSLRNKNGWWKVISLSFFVTMWFKLKKIFKNKIWAIFVRRLGFWVYPFSSPGNAQSAVWKCRNVFLIHVFSNMKFARKNFVDLKVFGGKILKMVEWHVKHKRKHSWQAMNCLILTTGYSLFLLFWQFWLWLSHKKLFTIFKTIFYGYFDF